MGLQHELYSPVLQDDFELSTNGGRYRRKFQEVVFSPPVRLPEYNVVNWIAVLYGFLPFALLASLPVFWYCSNYRFVYLYAMAIAGCCYLVSEIALKPLFKDFRLSRRNMSLHPDGRMKYGMPSGHALVTVALMVWVSLEVVLTTEVVVVGGGGGGGEEASARGGEKATSTHAGSGVHQKTIVEPDVNLFFLACVLGTCLPVPWSRVWNKDHTWAQVLMGSGFGVVIGICAYLLRVGLYHDHWFPWEHGAWSQQK
eukprot:g12373.t1